MNDEHPTPKTDFPHPGALEPAGTLSPEGPLLPPRGPLQDIVHGVQELIKGLADSREELAGLEKRTRGETKGVLLDLLEVADGFDRIFANLESRADSLVQQTKILAGNFRAVRRKLTLVMEKAGVVPIEVEMGTAAHPHLHQIVDTRPSPTGEEGTIVAVEQTGYYWGQEVLRYPEVVTVKHPEET
jgi:molecular chaperone GrpE (heat shock protein)